MADVTEWKRAFARQAKVDLDAREHLLQNPHLPACQQLHFLQMACEKLCKAHLLDRAASPDDLRRSHAYTASTLPIIARELLARKGDRKASWAVREIRVLARQIELLAPAVDNGGGHPQNVEYPWLSGSGGVVVPADFNFQLDLLYDKAGRQLLKVLYAAVEELVT